MFLNIFKELESGLVCELELVLSVGACTELLQYVTTVELELVTMSWSS